MDDLARLADINIHLDQQGMAIEGVTYDTPVSINLSQGDFAQERAVVDP